MSREDWWREFFLSGQYRLEEHTDEERTTREADFLVTALALTEGERVLDLCCGVGRHSNELARRGMQVVGVDFTPSYLSRAAEAGTPARFVRGDMRRVPIRGPFDAIFNVFSSFAYFDSEEQDALVIHEVARLLSPGGRFLLDVINPFCLARRFQSRMWTRMAEDVLLQANEMDLVGGCTRCEWTFVRGGARETYTSSIRLYTVPELQRMLNDAGLFVTALYGNFKCEELSLDTFRQILVAEKRAEGG
jgi:SAM-dependent methyltransferase